MFNCEKGDAEPADSELGLSGIKPVFVVVFWPL